MPKLPKFSLPGRPSKKSAEDTEQEEKKTSLWRAIGRSKFRRDTTEDIPTLPEESPTEQPHKLKKRTGLSKPSFVMKHTMVGAPSRYEKIKKYAELLFNPKVSTISDQTFDDGPKDLNDKREKLPFIDVFKIYNKGVGVSKPTLEIDFRDCSFNNISFFELSMINTKFRGTKENKTLQHCCFGYEQIFHNHNQNLYPHKGQVLLNGCHFDVDLDHCEFLNVNLESCVFRNNIFKLKFNTRTPFTDFRGVELKSSIIRNTEFDAILECEFKNIDFQSTIFSAEISGSNFFECQFSKAVQWPSKIAECKFDNSVFYSVDFRDLEFDSTTFNNCQFYNCQMADSQYLGRCKFSDCIFDNCRIDSCDFGGISSKEKKGVLPEMILGNGALQNEMTVSNVTFKRCNIIHAEFKAVLFTEKVELFQCDLQNVQMDGIRVSKTKECYIKFDQGSIRGLKFIGRKEKETRHIKLFRILDCSFDNVTLSSIPFDAIGLDETSKLKHSKCYDERQAEKIIRGELKKSDDKSVDKDRNVKAMLERAAKFYGQLYRICLDESQPDAAGDFYYRMMEVKNKAANRMIKKIGYQVAKVLCGYGERIIRVAYISLAILFIWTCIFMLNGLHVGDDFVSYRLVHVNQINATAIVEEDTKYVLGDVRPVQLLYDFIDAFRLSTNVFTNMGAENIRQPNRIGAFFESAESFLGIFMTALFVSVFFRRIAR